MSTWTKLLPFFVVEWIARKHGDRVVIGNTQYSMAYGPGDVRKRRAIVLIETDVARRGESAVLQ